MLLRQMPLVNQIQLLPHPQNLFRVDRNIARLPAIAPGNLMHHDPTMRQHEALARRPAAEQQGSHRRRLPKADGRDGAADVLHRVVDGEAGGHAAAGRVDVEADGFLRVVGFEEQELRHDGGAEDFFDFAVQADYALFQEAGEDVGGLDAAGDGLGYEGHGQSAVGWARGSGIVGWWEGLEGCYAAAEGGGVWLAGE